MVQLTSWLPDASDETLRILGTYGGTRQDSLCHHPGSLRHLATKAGEVVFQEPAGPVSVTCWGFLWPEKHWSSTSKSRCARSPAEILRNKAASSNKTTVDQQVPEQTHHQPASKRSRSPSPVCAEPAVMEDHSTAETPYAVTQSCRTKCSFLQCSAYSILLPLF